MLYRNAILLLIALILINSPGPMDAQKPSPDAKDNQHVDWEGWSFNWAMRPREGLVITDVSYRGRSVLKYAGLAELFTIYDQGQPRPIDFDQGYQLISLTPGIDCSSGEWCKLSDVKLKGKGSGHVMLHEERTGPNYLGGFGRTPGKTLVLWSGIRFTGGSDGYTFIIRWKFRDDGTLIPEVGATGVPQHLSTGDTSPHGAFIGLRNKQKVFAPGHVHSFLYRLDFDVDGEDNVVEEFNWQLDKDPQRDASAAPTATVAWTPIGNEAGRPLNAETFRSWRVVNRKSKNALGHARSYQLIPGSTGMFRSDARYNNGQEASAQADLWVTRFKPNEFGGMDALGKKYANGEDVENKNVVVWHWLSMHHFPRSEDWQHQPAVWCSFQLMPRDFLDASPLTPIK